MKPRLIVLGLGGTVLGVVAASAAFVACSSTPSTSNGPPDTGVGHDTGTIPLEGTTFDISVGDTSLGGDGHAPDVHIPDAGQPKDTGPAHPIDGGKLAACSPVTGACDIVSQNCSAGSECILTQSGTTFTTVCSPDEPTERLAAGLPCCPNDMNGNECDPGLECNGGNGCTDAASPGPGLPPGWGGSRCTPHCCMSDGGPNTANCGTAGDGGVQGHCDLQIVDNNNSVLYNVCTYPQLCEPLGIRPCIPGFTCTVTDVEGNASCSIIFNPNGDAGLAPGAVCESANDCAAGLICLDNGDAGLCSWECHVAGQGGTPFDAGLLNAMPGHGGCPTGQTCDGLEGVPMWLGVCAN